MKKCCICKVGEGCIKHHKRYLPQEIILVCNGCHNKIHSNEILEFDSLTQSRRMASIFYSNKGVIRKKSNGVALRKLTNSEKKIKEAMYAN